MTTTRSEPLIISPFSEVLSDFRAGKIVIIADDEARENEGDLVVASELVSAESIAFMMREGRGLVCVSIGSEAAKNLNLPLQVLSNNSRFNTPFAVSIDAVEAAPYGVTASGRSKTIARLLHSSAASSDFISPGHVFPLIANDAGVLGRQGQTEGSYDLARIAGLKPSAIICEILNADGTMARGRSLNEFAKKHALKVTTVGEILRQRVSHEVLVRKVAEADLETDCGVWRTMVFEDDVDGKEHLALVYGNPPASSLPVLSRVHSECLTGDVFGSERCDCGWQLASAMQAMRDAGAGVILYLRQEGRGIGLGNKLRAYALQDQGHDTVEANIKLGFAADSRDFAVAAKIFHELGLKKLKLMTNNPRKIATLSQFGIEVAERLPLIAKPNQHSEAYLKTKREKLGHLL